MIVSGFFYYWWTGDVAISREKVFVTRAIDGDTVVLENGERVRLLGENSPEKNEPFFDEAKNLLKSLVENKTIEIERIGIDKYGRTLGYLYVDDELINEKILSSGFAALYYYDKDYNYATMENAESLARGNGLGIWKNSTNEGCVKIVSFSYKDGGKCNNQERLVFDNSCDELNLTLKDDSSAHIYKKILNKGINSMNFSCIWNDDGDTVYLYDKSGMILFYRY